MSWTHTYLALPSRHIALLLGGNLIACLIRTKDIREDFANKYANTRGIISKKKSTLNSC